ncbi:T6SS immunity protein Tdi1 domain-containing protein [Aneurinibacillus tyrosinisolvens]|uniref:T6SS immunity protein Tdi1 domain-containing protein n=1 Tax=Aneurinibacillus tyrosinisolvens TaxID=1443435 RepID=UPI00063EFFC2|nr:T6SS immunity protein Tdi1 domain-containing protein [Aneurinibacillus tyrosinisolvens]
MFEQFSKFFNVPPLKEPNESDVRTFNDLQRNTKGFCELFGSYNGVSFGEGLYRLHDISKINFWDDIITQAFPEFSGRISCFGYDWLGRQFALDKERVHDGQPHILMFEPGTGEVLEIPCNFIDFHNDEIPNYHDACLASNFFAVWKSKNNLVLNKTECAGYKVLLFLGGQDVVENLEKNDMEVYWYICSQLIQQMKHTPEGTIIKNIGIDY